MELDDLKSALRQHLEAGSPERGAADLQQMLRKRSHSAIDTIRRNMWREIGFASLLQGALIYMALTRDSYFLQFMAIACGLILTGQLYGFSRKSKELGVLCDAPGSLRDTLQNLIRAVETFIQGYLRIMSWVMPVSAVAGGLLGYYIGSTKTPDTVPSPLDQWFGAPTLLTSFVVILAAVGLYAGAHYYVRWAVRYSYSRYLDALKNCLDDLAAS